MRFTSLFLILFLTIATAFGQTTNIGSSGITNGASPLSITNQLYLTDHQTWTTTGPLSVTGYVSAGYKDLTLAGSGPISLTSQLDGIRDLYFVGSGNRNVSTITGNNTVNINNTGTNVFSGIVNTNKLNVNGGVNTFNNVINAQNGGITTSGTANATFNNAVNSGGNGITVNGSGNIVFNGQINSAGSLTLNGTGTTTLAGNGLNNIANTYVNEGKLIMDQTGGYSINGQLTVGDGGTVEFQGNSQIPTWQNVTLMEGSTLLLGDTIQSFNNLTILGDSVIDFGSGGSSLNVNNLVVTSDITLTILNWNTSVDTFMAISNPNNAVVQIHYADTGQTATWGSGYIKPSGPVPEPSTYGIIFLGIAVSGVYLRRSYYRKRRLTS